MPRQTEPSANNALGLLLQRMLPTCQVRTENTQAIAGHPGLRPDILITATGRAPVVIEAEFAPAANVEVEALERLGLRTTADGRVIEGAVALRYPAAVADAADLECEIAGARLSYGVFTQDGQGPSRFPTSGSLDGSVEDLADLVRLVSVPQHAVDRAAEVLERGIDRAEKIIEEISELRPFVAREIAGLLGMTNVRQTWRMAGAIVANALIFQERLTGVHETVKSLDEVCSDSTLNPKRQVLAAWTEILAINYWPIFAIARDIVSQLQSWDAARILRTLRETAEDVNATGVNNAHDLTGRVFQRLIADRKYLATFYTLPASAALLARLAVAKMDGVDWSDAGAIGKLRVGDFACGTGALLSAVYDQMAARHERAGGDSEALHSMMMEEVLYGCDVMPSAIHITGSTLAGMQPGGKFENSRLYTLAYGRQGDGSVAIGSLELLQASQTYALFNMSDPAKRTGSVGEETAAQIAAEIPDASFDLVIMNPPFTRAGSDWEGSNRSEDYVKHFRGLSTDLETQKEMAKRLSKYAKGTCYHGYAGIASAFVALAHKKLRPGGVLALVLPLSAAAGLSWQVFRETVLNGYNDVNVLSIAASNNDDLSFSADTGLAECLVVARKTSPDETPDGSSLFTSLTRRPQGFPHASAISKEILGIDSVRRISDGPYGGTALRVGDESVGAMLAIRSQADGSTWGAVRLCDYSLAQTAYALRNSRLWLPGHAKAVDLATTPLSEIGERGVYHVNIAGAKAPFRRVPPSPTSTYPCLWNHDATKERLLLCDPDSQLEVRPGMESKAADVWSTAGRAHVNLDFRFNSQPLTVAITERNSIGGRAWPNVNFPDPSFDSAFSIWCNSTLGLLLFWWHANPQVAGRATTTISSVERMTVLDFRNFSKSQMSTSEVIFEEFRDKELQPAYLADADPHRALLDRYVVCDLLGFDEGVYHGVRRLAAKWCAEPSVHGGKRRPKDLQRVM